MSIAQSRYRFRVKAERSVRRAAGEQQEIGSAEAFSRMNEQGLEFRECLILRGQFQEIGYPLPKSGVRESSG